MKEKEVISESTTDAKEVNSGSILTYDQLNDACSQLYQENQYLMKQLQEANMFNQFKRMDYLFMVVNAPNSFDTAFVKACADEIQESLTLPDRNGPKE